MSELISRVRRMINATLVTHADGIGLDVLARFWGLPRPHYIQHAAWRDFLLAACYGKRGTAGCLFAATEGALGQYATVLTVVLDPDEPARLYSPDSLFEQAHVGRYVRVPGYGLFRTIGPVTVGGEYVDLCPIATRYWQAADWSGLDEAVTIDGATILAFEIHEPTPSQNDARALPASGISPADPAAVRIFVFSGPDTTTPPTYIQPGTVTAFTADGSSNELTFEAEHGWSDDDRIELVGTYYARTVIRDGWSATLPQSTVQVLNTASFDASGTVQVTTTTGVHNVTYTGKSLTTLTGCAGGTGVVVGGEDVVGVGTLPGGLSVDTVYYVIVVSPTEIQLSATIGGASINFTGDGSGPLGAMRARPLGEPLGGHVQSDVSEYGDQVNGPYPLYLSGSNIMADLCAVLQRLAPAGVAVRLMRPRD